MGTRPDNAGGLTIAPMTPYDWPSVRRIYADGMATGNATFETEPPDWDTWNRSRHPQCRLVARIGDEIVIPAQSLPRTRYEAGIYGPDRPIVAWAALSPVSARACYAGVAEHSIYVDETYRGRGIGKPCCPPSSPNPKPPDSGRYRAASSRRTRPASPSIWPAASASWAAAST